jgi:microcystin-dependent protein
MSEPYIAEIRPFAFNFAPRGWATCDGQLLPINQNQSLYSIVGTTYGGDGRTTFALPDLRSRVPAHKGNGINLGQRGGQEAVTLTLNELASHEHSVNASTDGATGSTLAGQVLAKSVDGTVYGAAGNMTPMNPTDAKSTGGGGSHDNMQPYLTISYCIALQGLYPPRN